MTVCLCSESQQPYLSTMRPCQFLFRTATDVCRPMKSLVFSPHIFRAETWTSSGLEDPRAIAETHLQHLQLLQPFLHKLLHPPLLCLTLCFPERIARPPFGVLAEVVGGKLSALSQEGSILDAQVSHEFADYRASLSMRSPWVAVVVGCIDSGVQCGDWNSDGKVVNSKVGRTRDRTW
jgi:hypothetical protein